MECIPVESKNISGDPLRPLGYLFCEILEIVAFESSVSGSTIDVIHGSTFHVVNHACRNFLKLVPILPFFAFFVSQNLRQLSFCALI
jgi:hypothetical protein